VAIIGVGMMGGSLGLSLRARGLARAVVGIDLRADILKRAREMQAIDHGVMKVEDGVQGADCVVVAAPVGVIVPLLERIAPYVGPETLVTDLGSVKTPIVAAGERLYGARFVGGHPMAGSERSGVDASMPGLFVGAAWAIVRAARFTLNNDLPARRIAALAEALGARTIALDAAQHDRIAALVSHLPHLLSFTYAQAVGADPEAELARTMAGGSYRDLMRVSAADADLWRDIFRCNREFLRDAITAYEAELQMLKRRYDLE
jgi:prephenate dehydrogenase